MRALIETILFALTVLALYVGQNVGLVFGTLLFAMLVTDGRAVWSQYRNSSTKTGQDETQGKWYWDPMTQTEIFVRSSQRRPEVGDMFRFRGGDRHLAHVTEVTKDGHILLANGVMCLDAKMLHDFYEVEK